MPSSIQPRATVLLVEDNSTARAALADILGLLEYAVLEVPDGLRALEILAQRPGAVDLILSDLVLPGMSGIELAQAARTLRPGLPLLVVTGYALLGRDEELAASGVAGWLEKPFTIDQLAGKLEEILDPGSTGDRSYCSLG